MGKSWRDKNNWKDDYGYRDKNFRKKRKKREFNEPTNDEDESIPTEEEDRKTRVENSI